jgi:hypothetical protein
MRRRRTLPHKSPRTIGESRQMDPPISLIVLQIILLISIPWMTPQLKDSNQHVECKRFLADRAATFKSF